MQSGPSTYIDLTQDDDSDELAHSEPPATRPSFDFAGGQDISVDFSYGGVAPSTNSPGHRPPYKYKRSTYLAESKRFLTPPNNDLVDGFRRANSLPDFKRRKIAEDPSLEQGESLRSTWESETSRSRPVVLIRNNPKKLFAESTLWTLEATEDLERKAGAENVLHDIILKVLHHVKIAIARYPRDVLADRDEAAQKVSILLYHQFRGDLEENLQSPSEAFERKLANQARIRLDDFVMAKRSSAFKNTVHGDYGLVAGRRSSSRSSNEVEQIFEDTLPAVRQGQRSRLGERQYSSSPTTSYSADPDAETRGSLAPTRRKGDRKHGQVKRSESPQITEAGAIDLRETQAERFARLDISTYRPYIGVADREAISRGLKIMQEKCDSPFSRQELRMLESTHIHVDFCLEEMEHIRKSIKQVTKSKNTSGSGVRHDIALLLREHESCIPQISKLATSTAKPLRSIGQRLLRNRDQSSIITFLQDVIAGNIPTTSQTLRIGAKPLLKKGNPKQSLSWMLLERETWGRAPFRVGRGKQPFGAEFVSIIEDSLTRRCEWTGASGDVTSLSWTGVDSFVAGATAHSDHHNMQYNKPGNLMVGSLSRTEVRALPDHKITRPLVTRELNVDNSLDSMRETQDPWLYTSVVSTAYSEISGLTFTASFDKTVKVWKVSDDGSRMNLLETWPHHGNVNFVVASDSHNLIATASDVCDNAVRVYNVSGDIVQSSYRDYCGKRAFAQAHEMERSNAWAYFPATIAWGQAPSVRSFLLVGYSPRSSSTHDIDIPEEKKNSGELCLWNAANGERVSISSARSQNVFEVKWHPTQPVFFAATSPCGTFEDDVRTQIRLFGSSDNKTFLHMKALDCQALDINELGIMPNSNLHCFVTASCTDGKTYVWDTAQGDKPIHILGHGESLDCPTHDLPREEVDEGVRFASWGKTCDRLYTGSSDGKVKAWDIRAPQGQAFVKTILAASGGITSGSFSKDFSKLLIGDSTGKIHLLTIDEDDPDGMLSEPSTAHAVVKRPKHILPHPEPKAPAGSDKIVQTDLKAYLAAGVLSLFPKPIGAVQGPNYATTGFFWYEAHEDNDGSLPLRLEFQAKQQSEISRPHHEQETAFPSLPKLSPSDPRQHERNRHLDFDIPVSAKQELVDSGIDLNFEEPEYGFEYEDEANSYLWHDEQDE